MAIHTLQKMHKAQKMFDAYKKENPKQLTDSNPCEWGYAMESSWIAWREASP